MNKSELSKAIDKELERLDKKKRPICFRCKRTIFTFSFPVDKKDNAYCSEYCRNYGEE